MESKMLLLIVSVSPHPSSLRDSKVPAGRGEDGRLLAAHADDQEVLMHELTLFEGLLAAMTFNHQKGA
jgi:hypothetical protein